MADQRLPFYTLGSSAVVVGNSENEWLVVEDTRGWRLPEGYAGYRETFIQTAERCTLQETGIQVQVKGILRVEHSVRGPSEAKMRVVYYAEPLDKAQLPRQTPDRESKGSQWVSLSDIKVLANTQPGLRETDLNKWVSYVEMGGPVAPHHFLSDENDPVPGASILNKAPLNLQDIGIMIDSIENGDDATLKFCILAGANPMQKVNDKLWTPLHLACKLKQDACVEWLLVGGADVTAQTHKGRSVLHFAAQSTPEILRNVLITLSALPNRLDLINQRDIEGNTPLHFAAMIYGKDIAWDLLIAAGADSAIQNSSMKTAENLERLP